MSEEQKDTTQKEPKQASDSKVEEEKTQEKEEKKEQPASAKEESQDPNSTKEAAPTESDEEKKTQDSATKAKEEGKKEKTKFNKQDVKPGMTVKVHELIKDVDAKGKERERIQVFEGLVLAVKKPRTESGTITVRKISNGVGVEKIFPIHSPLVKEIEPIKQAKVRRAKLYFLRNYKKRLKETRI